MENPSSLGDPQAADRSFDEHIEHWAGEFQTLRRQTGNRRLLAVGALLLPGLLTCVLTMSLRSVGSWAPAIIFFLGATGTLIAFFVSLTKASGFESRGVQQLAGEIQETCGAEGLRTPQVIEALSKRVHGGGVLEKVLRAVDPDTVAILEIRKRGLQFFQREPAEEIPPLLIHVSGSSGVITSVTVKGEEHADRFRGVALDYLKHKACVEAIAALAMVQSIYTDIAPPGGN
jgi:hypothetical protein